MNKNIIVTGGLGFIGSNLINLLLNKDFNIGYNAAVSKYGDMFDFGIVDPAKVTRCALQNAVSVASTLITTSHAIVN